MSDEGVWVQAGTLTLPYDTLRTLHTGVSEVRLLSSVVTNLKQVGKRVSLLGRENTLAANEVSFLREIDHANVAKVFDIAEVAGSDPLLAEFEIIMPYYENGSLLDCLVRGERFSIGEARDITVKALRGLAHLHDRHRILHRDVKPANLFRSDDDSLVKIGDFGEAMRMSEDANCEPLLSPQFWTSPETFRGMRYTAASDLYSLGLSFFELLSGPFPYDDYTLDRLATRLKKGHHAVLPRHLQFAPHVPASLRRIVNKSIRTEPNERYQSAEAMIDDLLGARFVDWKWPQDGGGSPTWTGAWRGVGYRVVARHVRGKGWRATGERQYRSGWRRIPGCSDVDAQGAFTAASAMFSLIERQLSRI